MTLGTNENEHKLPVKRRRTVFIAGMTTGIGQDTLHTPTPYETNHAEKADNDHYIHLSGWFGQIPKHYQ